MDPYYLDLLQKKDDETHRRVMRTLFYDIHPSLLNFSSMDFLNLLQHPFVREEAIDFTMKWGTGSTLSRTLPSYIEKQLECQETLRTLLGCEKALLLEPTPDLFSHLIQSLIRPKTFVIKSHHFRYSIKSPINMLPFDPKSSDELERILVSLDYSSIENVIILVDSHESYQNNLDSLKEVAALSQKHEATLIVDDTLSFGVLGRNGMGLSAKISGIDIILGNFGKPFGSYSSYIGASKDFIDYLTISNNFIQSLTPISPLNLGLVKASLQLIPSMSSERKELLSIAKKISSKLSNNEFNFYYDNSHILRLNFSSEEEIRQIKRHLTEHQALFSHSHGKRSIDLFLNRTITKRALDDILSILKIYRFQPLVQAL